jgi:MFS family permease
VIDFATFLFAVSTLMLVRFPPYKSIEQHEKQKTFIWQEARDGWRFLLARRGLLGLLFFFAFVNFTLSLVSQLMTPMVLSFSTPEGLGLIVSAGGVGMLVGSVIMGAWGGPRRRMIAIYGFGVLQGLTMILMGWRECVILMALARLTVLIGSPIVNGTAQVLQQRKVPADMQGRVFATSRMLSWMSIPLAYLLSGPLADRIFEPMMARNGELTGSVGQIIGVGDGRGIALMFILGGLLTLLGTVAAFLYAPMRNVERDLADVTPDDPTPPDAVASTG